jgi:hypothetical protein
MRLGAAPLGAGFHQEIPWFFEIHRQHSRRKAAVRADGKKKTPIREGFSLEIFSARLA